MSKVNIVVNKKTFTIACDAGQEQRVAALGAYIDEKYAELAQAGAAPNETYMLVLTSLVIADEMMDGRDQVAKAKSDLERLANAPAPSTADLERQIDANLRASYDAQFAVMQKELEDLRRQLAQARQNVVSIEQVKVQMETEAKRQLEQTLLQKETELAEAVDSLTDQLENVVKKLKRA